MNTTANTTDHGYITAYAAGGGTVRHIVQVTGDYYGAYAAAAVCGVSPRIRWSNTRWTGESEAYPTPAAALEANTNVCRRCAAAVAKLEAVNAAIESVAARVEENITAAMESPAFMRALEAADPESAAIARSRMTPAESLEENTMNTEDAAPAAVPVRADSVQANTPVTGYVGTNPVVMVQAVTPAVAPGYVVITWKTEDGGTFDEIVPNYYTIYIVAPVEDDAPAPAESLEENTMNTPAESPAVPVVTVQFPALTGDVVTTAHTLICEARGHATHTVDGVDTGRCPRCGELKAPAAPEYSRGERVLALEAMIEAGAVSEDDAPAPEDVPAYALEAVKAAKTATGIANLNHGFMTVFDATVDALKARAAAAGIHPRALELVAVSEYPDGARVILDPATAPTAEYGTARAVVTAYFQGGPGRGECVDAVILTVTGGDSHPERNYAALDALEALQLQVSGNITAGQYQTLVDPDSYAGTVFVYGTWSD